MYPESRPSTIRTLLDLNGDLNSSHKYPNYCNMRSPTTRSTPITTLILLVLLHFSNAFQFMAKWKAPLSAQEIADQNAVKERFGDKSKYDGWTDGWSW